MALGRAVPKRVRPDPASGLGLGLERRRWRRGHRLGFARRRRGAERPGGSRASARCSGGRLRLAPLRPCVTMRGLEVRFPHPRSGWACRSPPFDRFRAWLIPRL